MLDKKASKGEEGAISMACIFCKKMYAAGPEMGGKHKHVAEEWIKVKVVASGITKSEQQQSLHKKIHCHRTSDFHEAAEKTVERAKEKTVETLTAEMMRDQFLTTDWVFRTVYKIAKSRQPYTDLETDTGIQVLNGLDMGRTLHSEKSCANI